ncbi:MAG: ABC transporter ATP-binding protein [Schleiferilactobacillus harbinensis]
MDHFAVTNLTFAYAEDAPPIFQDLTFAPEPGTFNLLTGPSGSGKSTLLKLLAGLYPQYGGVIQSGQVTVNDTEISTLQPFQRAAHVAMLFQNPSRQFAMRTVLEQLQFALANLQLSPPEIDRRIQTVLTDLHLTQFTHRALETLSGGEQQRVALASVLALGSSLILLDEPFANVDAAGRTQLLADLKTLQRIQHKTIILADHDLSGYAGLVDQLYHVDGTQRTLLQESPAALPATTPATPVQGRPLTTGPLAWHDLSLTVGDRPLITAAQFTLPASQLGLLSGDNGAGKSTLFAALTRQRRYAGDIRYQDRPAKQYKLKQWALQVAEVYQNSPDQFIRIQASDELALSAQHSLHPTYWTAERIAQAAARLNLAAVLDHVSYALSGGQQKKLQVLSMLIMGQPVLLLDEPFAGLDQASLQAVLTLLQQTVHDLQLSALVVSHQRQGVVSFMDYELRLADQQLQLIAGEAA